MENKEFTVTDRLGELTITGQLLSDQRFGSDRSPRWTDLALYRIVEIQRDAWFTARCRGCKPRRAILISTASLDGDPIFCDVCKKLIDLPEDPFTYALEIIARSWVYHKFGGPCVKRKHQISVVQDVKRSGTRWRYLVPCTRCKPGELEHLRPGDRIAEERSDPHIYVCSNADMIVRRLYHHSGEISMLAAKLLREAAREDPDIAKALVGDRRI